MVLTIISRRIGPMARCACAHKTGEGGNLVGVADDPDEVPTRKPAAVAARGMKCHARQLKA